MVTKRILLGIIVCLCLAFIGCSQKIEGTYIAESEDNWLETITFSKDGTCVLDFGTNQSNSNYEIEKKVIITSALGQQIKFERRGADLFCTTPDELRGTFKLEK